MSNDQWYTPREIIESARTVLGCIDLDPASCEMAQRTVQATRYFTAEDDGLAQQWAGRVWLNPPYSRGLIRPFIDKLTTDVEVTSAICLVTNAPPRAWFKRLMVWSHRVCYPARRVAFFDATGVQQKKPNFDNAIFYRGANPGLFADVFGELGMVLDTTPAPAIGHCQVCRQQFDAVRRDAQFCRSTCRSRHHRKRSAA